MKKFIKPLLLGTAFLLGLSVVQPKAESASEINNYTIKNGTIYTDGDINGSYEYKLKASSNPLIHKQVSNAITSLSKDKRFYSQLTYLRANGTSNSRTTLVAAHNMNGAFSGAGAFYYSFYDDKSPVPGSFMHMSVVGLFINDIQPTPKDYAEVRFKEGMKNSLVGIFGVNPGVSIYNTIMKKYVQMANGPYTKPRKQTLNFGNYKMVMEDDGVIEIDFYYNKRPDVTPPKAPSVNTIKYASKTVTGKAEPSTRVYTTVGKKSFSAVANTKGAFTIKVPPLYSGTLTIYAVDNAGNKSPFTQKTISKK